VCSSSVQGIDRSVLIAVEPLVLEGVLAFLIERAQQGEVVQFHSTPHPLGRRYDAAVVSCPAPAFVQAEVVICFPADGAGRTSVTKNGDTTWTVIQSHGEIIRLLEEHCPKATRTS
jgi:hypothetical protein